MFRAMSDRIPAEFRPGPVRVPNPPTDALPNSSSSNSVPLGASAVPRGFPASSGPQNEFGASSDHVPNGSCRGSNRGPNQSPSAAKRVLRGFRPSSDRVPAVPSEPPASAVLAVPAKFRVSFRAPGDVLVQFRVGFRASWKTWPSGRPPWRRGGWPGARGGTTLRGWPF